MRTKRKTTEQFKNEVHNLSEGRYELVSDYVNSKTKVRVKHKECGYEYLVRPDNFIQGKRCPKCRLKSKGEYKIYNYLKEKGIDFEPQFEVLLTSNNYNKHKYDFAIKSKNKLLGFIEYDGQQHFKSVKFFGGDDNFRRIVKNDTLKENYASMIGVPLLRISYKEYNKIEYLINNFISEVNMD